MNTIDTTHLNDAELEVAAGGMDCQTALGVAAMYMMAGDILKTLGCYDGATQNYYTAGGVLIGGGCRK